MPDTKTRNKLPHRLYRRELARRKFRRWNARVLTRRYAAKILQDNKDDLQIARDVLRESHQSVNRDNSIVALERSSACITLDSFLQILDSYVEDELMADLNEYQLDDDFLDWGHITDRP